MSRNTKYQSHIAGCNQDFRYSSDYRPTINTPSLIPGRKRQFRRVHHDSPPNQPSRGASGSRIPSDENRPRESYKAKILNTYIL